MKKLKEILFKRHKTKTKDFNRFFTIPNLITLVRMVLTTLLIALCFESITRRDLALNYLTLGILVFVAGDILDGFLARRLGQESISGAILDIIADRIYYPFYYFLLSVFFPEILPISVLFFISFNFLDLYLSLQFLRFNIPSINYFWKVDGSIYNYNFSPFGKFANSGILLILSILYSKFLRNPLILLSMYLTVLSIILLKSFFVYKVGILCGEIKEEHIEWIRSKAKAVYIVLLILLTVVILV